VTTAIAASPTAPFESGLYEGWVMHRRLAPRHHRFRYRVFSTLIDLDELPELDRRLNLFGWNRWAPFSFHDTDHGGQGGLREWLDETLARAGIAADGPKHVLCYPRLFGYVFNPLSVWFCHRRDGELAAIVYEVHNTYDERHAYVLPAGNAAELIRHGCEKSFYVSPFLSTDCTYRFRVHPPGATVAVAIDTEEAGKPILNASFAGKRSALTDRALLWMLFKYPLMTVKVVVAIHFEAVRLMLKGVKRHPHVPAAPQR
jgi:DUF1365 family protein